jgi:hypothetical protein
MPTQGVSNPLGMPTGGFDFSEAVAKQYGLERSKAFQTNYPHEWQAGDKWRETLTNYGELCHLRFLTPFSEQMSEKQVCKPRRQMGEHNCIHGRRTGSQESGKYEHRGSVQIRRRSTCQH